MDDFDHALTNNVPSYNLSIKPFDHLPLALSRSLAFYSEPTAPLRPRLPARLSPLNPPSTPICSTPPVEEFLVCLQLADLHINPCRVTLCNTFDELFISVRRLRPVAK